MPGTPIPNALLRPSLICLFAFAHAAACSAQTEGPSGGADTALPSGDARPGPGAEEAGVTDPAAVDVGVPASGCEVTDPNNPPIGASPEACGATRCSSTTRVDACPTDTACMATARASSPRATLRIGRLRLWKPDAALSLASIAVDPSVNARCANGGTEGLSWLLEIDRSAGTLTTGSSRPSTDGTSFTLADEEPSGAICPGFVAGPTMRIAPVKFGVAPMGSTGFAAGPIPALNVAVYEGGLPWVLPLREVVLRVPSMPDPSCIGAWSPSYWCDGDSLGWTTGGQIVAKIGAEEADAVPVRSAGCQSLCALLVNDATKTDGRRCRRGADGKVVPMGNACIGGTDCTNAFVFSATFGAYGVTIR